MNATVQDVKDFWNSSPCQSDLSSQSSRRAYFQEIARRRYQGREWHIPLIARFDEFKGKTVLEIGCGIGTDGFEFASRGADYHGIDLTPNSVELARERFALLGAEGHLRVVNAEEGLPFRDEMFDHIYSFGVIHHSPNPPAIAREMFRVLKPGGTFTVMLYNRSSINYYLEIMFLRRMLRWLLLPAFMPRVLSALTGFERSKLEGHRDILVSKERAMSKEEWISRNTDGPDCPLAKVYNRRQASQLFQEFSVLRQEVWEFNKEHWSFLGRLIPEGLARRIGRRWGWHRIIFGVK